MPSETQHKAPHDANPSLASLVHALHFLIALYAAFGWLSPWQAGVFAHALLNAGILLHWSKNEGRCVLTDWEARLRGKPQKDASFMRDVFERVIGRRPTQEASDRLIYACMYTGLFISVLRLVGHHAG